jgi:hypothetical protein
VSLSNALRPGKDGSVAGGRSGREGWVSSFQTERLRCGPRAAGLIRIDPAAPSRRSSGQALIRHHGEPPAQRFSSAAP